MVEEASDWTEVNLPEGADPRSVLMHTRGRRDLIACKVSGDGWRSFEDPLPEYLFKTARARTGIVVDVGANTGFYSLLAASAAPDNTVMAFEPIHDISVMLGENAIRNGLQRRITVNAHALSSRGGTMDIYIPTQDHGLVETSASLERDFKDSHSGSQRVSVRRLDRAMFSPRHIFRPRHRDVSVIKVDVEGHEAAVLRGAYWTVRRHRPIIFAEVLPHADLDGLNAFIDRHRYRDLRLVSKGRPAIAERVAFDPMGWNHALVPQERVEWFLSL